MALIDKNKKIIANLGSKTIIFNTEQEFNVWRLKLKNPIEDIKKFIIIKNYSEVTSKKIIPIVIKNQSFGIHSIAEYFTLTSATDMSITPKWQVPGTMEYSIDDQITWKPIESNNSTEASKKFAFRGNMSINSLSTSKEELNNWEVVGGTDIIAGGDITTLLKPSGNVKTLDKFAFSRLFLNWDYLVLAPELPSPIMGESCYYSMFAGCRSLKLAPALPATTLAISCYEDIFAKCVSLWDTIELPATILKPRCYAGMFKECPFLTFVLKISATVLAEDCCNGMFSDCRFLKEVPELLSTTLANRCYFEMFSGCTTLPIAPILSSTNLADECYFGMFKNCVALTVPPELPATTLMKNCYTNMFYGCKALFATPKLPCTNLKNECYNGMFEGCTSLQEIEKISVATLADRCYNFMFNDTPAALFSNTATQTHTYPITNNSTFTHNKFSPLGDLLPNQTVYLKTPPTDYFVVTSKSNITVTPKWINSGTMQYSINGRQTWIDINSDNETLPSRTIYFRGNMADNSLFGYSYSGNAWRMVCSNDIKVSGDITTLLKPSGKVNTLGNYAFANMFEGRAKIQNVVDLILPSNVLGISCYDHIFSNCPLSYPPKLPAMTLATDCYRGMFFNCFSLKIAPELPATNLKNGCYAAMFQNCIGITVAPDLPATTLADTCYSLMFYGCSYLISTPKLLATVEKKECYSHMFNWCTRLTNIAEIGILDPTEVTACSRMFCDTPNNLFSTIRAETHSTKFTNRNTIHYIMQFSPNGDLLPLTSIYLKNPK